MSGSWDFRQVFILHNLANWVTFAFSLRTISGNTPRSRDSLRHCLRSPKLRVWQFSNLIIPIDNFYKKPYTLKLIINRSQDNRVQIFRKSGGNVKKLYFPKLSLTMNRYHLHNIFLLLNLVNQSLLWTF